ncbi:two-component sensor histidine kinase [Actinoplanes cyaneus]|uniref:histidine kinase n=1 Tax=Actinoplanes cyaneus TaxID=52696 RepID=A0A919IJJ7_9ACTN|nr:histidine kinase [Actinoplanes cyaneus]MCW2140362.1 Signal transduction histidine kinase [Actinoplanes cyaneus]GID65681.1 two-component sensor histidine kinase [Actinoplanes cyaneus]
MTLPGLVAPLISGVTYRRGVHLLLGAVIALPYVLLAVAFRRMIAEDPANRSLFVVTAVVAAAVAAVPAFLGSTRALEIAAARSLLGVGLPDTVPGKRLPAETRIRGALWFGLHLAAGAVIAVLLLTALPVVVLVLGRLLGLRPGDLPIPAPVTVLEAVAWVLVALGVLAGTVYVVAAFGALAALMAPVLLGPSATEREHALEVRARQLAERNRLARELHDSIGHALTLATLQAGAAGQVFDTDPAFARRALTVIEETSRAAMDDLDHVLGVLRDARDHDGTPRPRRTLVHLGQLCQDAEAAGVPVDLTVAGPLAAVPATMSREGFRIVQEALTNVARHAGRAPATVRVAVAGDELTIEVLNPMPEPPPVQRRGGHGLGGMRERVDLLRGRLTFGHHAGRWRVTARLPLRDPGDGR